MKIGQAPKFEILPSTCVVGAWRKMFINVEHCLYLVSLNVCFTFCLK